MKKSLSLKALMPVYVFVFCCCLIAAVFTSRAVTVLSQTAPIENRQCVIIDAGHGGVDGGATSCTGVLESQINLEIARRLDDLMHLLGIHTYMIRNTDCSVYTDGTTIAQKKISDLKERVRIVNNTKNALLLSIHQNTFSDEKYDGAQIFYAPTDGSNTLAQELQTMFIRTLNPGSTRKSKKADSVYLMKNINCVGVLVECGFLSNPTEEAKLRSESYQKNICCVLACTISRYLQTNSLIA